MPTQECRLPVEPLKGPLITPLSQPPLVPASAVSTLGVTGAASSVVPVKITCPPCMLLHLSVGQGQPPCRAPWGPASPTFQGVSLPSLCQPPCPPCGPPGPPPSSFSLGPLSVQRLPLVSVTHTLSHMHPRPALRHASLRAPSPQPRPDRWFCTPLSKSSSMSGSLRRLAAL